MKRFFSTISAFFVALSAMAQLYAFSLNGKAQIQREDSLRDVFVADLLLENDLLTTEEYGYIVILDRKNNKKYSLQSPFPQPIHSLIASQGRNAKALPKEHIQRLYLLLMGLDTEDSSALPNAEGVTYRSENIDLTIAHSMAQNAVTETVDFQFLDQFSLQPVPQVEEGQHVIIQIENHTDTPLYTNIIDSDPTGEKFVLLPVNTIDSLSDVFIPPHSRIRLKSNPISFAPGGTSDELTLIAHSEPFNISNVMRLIQSEAMEPATNEVAAGNTSNQGYVNTKTMDILAVGHP